ncbi:hypothetical protein LguiA_006600 [Lonicera macranthoides]
MIEILLSLQQTDPEYYSDKTINSLFTILLHTGRGSDYGMVMTNLLNNPQVLKKAQMEIKNNVGQERLIDESNLSELPYLECVINETLWIHPVTPLLMPHESLEDCTVGSFRILRGTMRDSGPLGHTKWTQNIGWILKSLILIGLRKL